MPLGYEDIIKDLRNLGITNGDIVAVHSSLKKVGWLEGGPETFIEALKSVVGRRGTILMPTFTKPSDVFIVNDARPVTGLLPDTFRKGRGVIRSLHPTHSVAVWGRFARNLARDHQVRQALGRNSPFHRLAKRGGKVLLAGVDFTRASVVHVAESLASAPYQDIAYPGYKRRTVMVAANGKRVRYRPEEYPGCSAGFTVVQERMERQGLLTRGGIGNAPAIVASADLMIQAALEILSERGDGLLCENPSCEVCPARRERVRLLGWRYSAPSGNTQ